MDGGGAHGAGDPSRVVIFYSTGDAWRVGHLVSGAPAGDDGRGLRVVDAENRQMYTVRGREDIHEMHAPLPAAEDVNDLVMLPDVAEGPLLCALRVRYNDGKYYTALGRDQLLLVNPSRPLDTPPELPAPSLYLHDHPGLPLHPWAVGARAWKHVAATGRDAVVVCLGDPGSGKTTAAQTLPDIMLHDVYEAQRERSQTATLRITAESYESVSERQIRRCISEGLGVPDEAIRLGHPSAVPAHSDPAVAELADMTSFDIPVRFCRGTAAERELWAKAVPSILPQLEYHLNVPRVACPSLPDVLPFQAGNVILSAFCNARTTRNVNASKATLLTRFAVQDDRVVGTEVRPFLLECARAAAPPHGERNFHIFYYLVSGLPDWERQRYHLPPADELDPTTFGLLGRPRQEGSARDTWGASMSMATMSMMGAGEWVNEIPDFAQKYKSLVEAFEACELSPRLMDWVFRTLSAILHLGQVQFPFKELPPLHSAAELLQVTPDALTACLTRHIQTVRGEPVSIHLTAPQSCSARDTLIRCLYQKVVDVVVASINVNLAPREEITGWVSVLDAMGPVNGAHNDITALATNYAHEVLQNYYNGTVFDDSVAECIDELGSHCNARVVPYDDAYAVVKLLRANQGVFAAIDDESTQQAPSEAKLLETLTSTLKHHPKFERKLTAPTSFCVAHACGEVEYSVAGMVATNRNAVLPHDVKKCLSGSLCDYTSHAFLTAKEVRERQQYEAESGTGKEMPPEFIDIHHSVYLTKVPTKPTYLAMVKQQVQTLIALLEGARPYYIQCVRSTKTLSTTVSVYHGRYVLRQLRSLGVLNTLRQKLANYAAEDTYEGLLHSLGAVAPRRSGDVREQVQALCDEHGLVPGEDYQMGKTQVFLKSDAYTTLLAAQDERHAETSEVVSAAVRALAALLKVHAMRDAHVEAMRAELRQDREAGLKEAWMRQRGKREDTDRGKLLADEVRSRRNVDNQEAVDYITIMTGLIEGVERLRSEEARRQEEEEREQHLRLKALLREERVLEDRSAKDRLSDRMLVQGGRLDRVLARKYDETQRMRERKAKTETTQQRLLRNRLEAEKHRLRLEQKITEKENIHEHFVEQKKIERHMAERRKVEVEEMDRQAREARLRARQAWEESKRDELDLDMIEREVVVRVEQELMEEKRKESFREKRQRAEEQREGERRVAHLERLRANRQLERERREREAARKVEEEKRKREQAAWREQQNQRALKEELGKIRDEQERRRFARRQREKQQLAQPKVFQQLVASSMGSSVSGSEQRARSPLHGSRSLTPGREPPSYPTLTPSLPFHTTTGNPIHAKRVGAEKREGLHRFASRTAGDYRAASASPGRVASRSPSRTSQSAALRIR